MFQWVRNLFGLNEVDPVAARRRWEASRTSRLNEAHWQDAREQHINRDLSGEGKTIRQRCHYELANNGFVAGMVRTYQTDVVGQTGPSLQVRTENNAYADAFESVWKEWSRAPEITGQMTLAECMEQWIRALFPDGEYVFIFTSNAMNVGSVKMRIQLVQARRLRSPMKQYGVDITLGVRRTLEGRPVSYFFDEHDGSNEWGSLSIDSIEIPADRVVHYFERYEPGQVRGVPWLAPVLPVIADLRDYDKQVLDAARQAADQAVLLWTEHDAAPFLNVNTETEIKRRTIGTVPPGWKVSQLKPEQPHTEYTDYRGEKMREFGRPIQMPLMMVALDSTDHNYSSARFDGQLYQRGVAVQQQRLTDGALMPIVHEIEREMSLRGRLPEATEQERALAEVPDDVKYLFTWPVPPHVDPQREANAAETRMRTGISTVTAEVGAHGDDFEGHLETLAKEVEAYEDAGLVHPTIAAQRRGATQPTAPDSAGDGEGTTNTSDEDGSTGTERGADDRHGVRAVLLNGAHS